MKYNQSAVLLVAVALTRCGRLFSSGATRTASQMLQHWGKLSRLGGVGALLVLSASAMATEPGPFAPEAFELELEGFFYRGIPIKVTGTQTLTDRGNGLWRLELEARGPFVRLSERSDFRWENGTTVPVDYRFRSRAPFESEQKRIQFQPDQDRIRVEIDGERTDHPYRSDWYDPMSFTVLLLRDVDKGVETSVFTVLDRSDEREYVFTRNHDHDLPRRAAVISQDAPNRGITYIVLDQERMLPAHMLRWRNGSIDYQIRTLSGRRNGEQLTDFPHWPNPRRNIPNR